MCVPRSLFLRLSVVREFKSYRKPANIWYLHVANTSSRLSISTVKGTQSTSVIYFQRRIQTSVMYHIPLQPCSDPTPTCSNVFGHCHNAPTLLWCLRCFSHSVTTITMLQPCSNIFSLTITILQFRTFTPLISVMLHLLHDLHHHSRFCGQQ